jgi:hypothetical protein
VFELSDSDDTSMLLSLTIFLVLLALVLLPAVMLVDAAGSTSFTSSTTVNNVAPSSIMIDPVANFDPSPGTTKNLTVYFNATDSNGYADLNDNTASVSINRSGETTRQNTTCAVLSHPTLSSTRYNCTIVVYYYDGSGVWSINASVRDTSTAYLSNVSTFSLNTLDSLNVSQTTISFTGGPGTSNIAASPQPQQVTNIGNQNYTTVQITGFSFTSGSNVLGVGNVTMNWTNSGGVGQQLVNNSAVSLTNGTLAKGAGSSQNIYFWLSIPTNTPAGSYTAATWSVGTS